MRIRKKAKSGDESYWKSFTDIMAGLLLVILLVLMLLMLYMSQLDKEQHKEDHEYDYSEPYDEDDLHDEDHKADELYDRPPESGGGGGGVDDPGTSESQGVDNDYGHDKAAVLVTVVDEETRKTIQKEGILFYLYNSSSAAGKTMSLNTYYPVKITYKSFETTKDGTFYLPEKVRYGWYTLHNMKAPTGYGIADDVSFQVTESKDWSDPYKITVPMSPSKSIIYVQSVDADTSKSVGGVTYEVYAEEDIVTLDGTVRFKAGDKVDEFKCDKTGKGGSKKLYFGKYSVVQKQTAKYYAVVKEPLSVELNYLDPTDKIYKIKCQKTRVDLTLVDEETHEPIAGAVFSVTGKENATTDELGKISLTDFDKSKTYTVSLVSLPESYRIKTREVSVDVDENGYIHGEAVNEAALTAYIIRLTVSVTDQLFGGEVSNIPLRLYNSSGAMVEEWSATGSAEVFEDIEPGKYSLEINGDKANRVSVEVKDQGGKQLLETAAWTILDTLAVVGGAVAVILLVVLVTGLIASRRKKKRYEKE